MRSRLAALAAFTVLAFASPVYAGTYGGAMFEKAASGLLNIVYSPLEILVTPVRFAFQMEENHDPAMSGIQWGIAPGFILAGSRLGLGASQLLTFPIVDPARDYSFAVFLVNFDFYEGDSE